MTEKEPSAERGDTEGAGRGGIQKTGGAEKEKELSTTPALGRAPEQVREFFAAITTMGPRPDPLFEKLTPEHITKLIDALGKNDERDWDNTAADRRYHFAYFVGSFLMLFAVMAFLLSKGQTAVFSGLSTAILGFAAGYGVGKRKSSEG